MDENEDRLKGEMVELMDETSEVEDKIGRAHV
jgi:hypothetical protein